MSAKEGQSIQRRPKGSVAIAGGPDRGLRLRFRYGGQQWRFALGLPDTPANRKAAQRIASEIERDIAYNNFDETLKRYSLDTRAASGVRISPAELFAAFSEYKSQYVKAKTLASYNSVKAALELYFQSSPARSVTPEDAESFIRWYTTSGLDPRVQRERVRLIQSSWDWAISKHPGIETNPWLDKPSLIQVPPKQRPKPFTREEIAAILKAFECDPQYSYYTLYVTFLFGTGCRPSEAIGLRWGHISDDCSTVWIGETLTRGVRGSTKTNRERTITLTPRLQRMFQQRRPAKLDPQALIFTGPRGAPLRDNDFRDRAWKTILERLGIVYRKPYTTRSSLISHALDMGHSPIEISQLTGHDVEVLYRHYTGHVNSKPRLPEIIPEQ